MRIKKISVNGLFGMFDHVIPMNMEDRITIIHGPNGFGKTSLLRLINGLFNSRYSELRSIPFRTFRIDFDDANSLLVTKGEEKVSKKRKVSELEFIFSEPNSTKQPFVIKALEEGEFRFPPSMVQEVIPGMEQIGPEAWRFLPTDEILSLEDIIERYGDSLPIGEMLRHSRKREPDWLAEIKESMNVRFIAAQRLLGAPSPRRPREYERGPSMRVAVENYSDELSLAIKSKLAESAELSQSLDRTFPVRLVEHRSASDLSTNQLHKKLSELEERRSRLMGAGLLDKEVGLDFQVAQQIDDRTKSVLSVYVEDVDRKLGVFDELANKIDLLTKIVSERFLYKKMSISKERGFKFSTFDGSPLPLASLSSGEQHELVLFYELLFKVKPNSLILIDEPELSLHVAWQVQFLNDIQEIIALSHIDALLATHSPQIINNRWDLAIQLKGPTE